MEQFNFEGKSFQLLDNSSEGEASSKTLFKYQQEGNLVTAEYSGGSIIYGKIIAKLQGDQLEMLYNCYTNEQELKAGKALAKVSKTSKDKLKLSLKWEWLETKQKGTSTYIEI